MKKWSQLLAACLAAVLFCISGLTVSASKEQDAWQSGDMDTYSRTVTVGFSDAPGLSEQKEDGSYSGVVFDFLSEISKYTNWKYEFKKGSPEETSEWIMNGEVDIVGGMYYSPDYEEDFFYPDYSIGSSYGLLIARVGDFSINKHDLSSLNGKTIGIYEKATEKIKYLKQFLAINGIDCRIKYYKWEDFVDKSLQYYLGNGDVDLLSESDIYLGTEYRVVTEYQGQPYYLVTPRGNQEILDGLNMALRQILDVNPDMIKECHEKYYPSNAVAHVAFSDSEKEFLQRGKSIRVAVERNFHPLCCPADAQHSGIMVDVLERISERTGLKFDYIYVDTYEEMLRMVQEGYADIVGGFLDSEISAEKIGLALTVPYTSLDSIIVKNRAVEYPSEDLKAAVVEGRDIGNLIRAEETTYYPTVDDCVAAVNRGDADFTFGLSATLESVFLTSLMQNVSFSTVNEVKVDISFALSRPVDTNLLNIMNKVIHSITNSEMEEISARNLVSSGYKNITLSAFIYSNPFIFIIAVLILLIMGFAVFYAVTRLRVRSLLMDAQLQKAEAASRAKSEFLSRMSHEIRTPMNAIVGLTNLLQMTSPDSAKKGEYLKQIQLSAQYLLTLINDVLDMSRIESGKMSIIQEKFSIKELLGELDRMLRQQMAKKNIFCNYDYQGVHDLVTGDSIRIKQVLVNLLSNAVKFTPENGSIHMDVKERSYENGKVELFFCVKDNGIGIAKENQKRIFESFEQAGNSISNSAGTGLGLAISQNIIGLMGGVIQVESVQGKATEFYFTLHLPLADKDESDLEPGLGAVTESLSGVRVLLAEDNDINAQIAMELLQLKDMKVDRACDGKEALDRFLGSGRAYYQLILMDLQMPVMDGLQATKEIRTSNHPDASSIPVIAMTANTFNEDKTAAEAAGMNAFVQKPVDIEYLYEVIQHSVY